MARNEQTHEFEAKIMWTGDKSRLIETTLPITGEQYKYFLPKKCTFDMNESDGDGHYIFMVSDWWMQKVINGDFWADD